MDDVVQSTELRCSAPVRSTNCTARQYDGRRGAVLGAIVVAAGAWSAAGPRRWFAFAAGLVGPIALFAFYKALALGPMRVVSLLAMLSVAVPVGVGPFLGERPGPVQLAGIADAVGGVVLAGGPQPRGAPVERATALLTLVAALGFGTVFALIAEASTTVTGLYLSLFVRRLTDAPVGGAVLAASLRRGGNALPEGGFPYRSLPAPAARSCLSERVCAVQAAGVGLALVGTALPATG
nr:MULTISPECIES: DMT family transporter [Streptomyces]